jgi:tetratricopeptide (TPR) repeat protein
MRVCAQCIINPFIHPLTKRCLPEEILDTQRFVRSTFHCISKEVTRVPFRIRNHSPGEKVPQLAMASTPTEWAQTGKSLFAHKSYLQAMFCFERAVLPREMAVANAYHLREQARSTRSKVQQGRSSAFIRAAEAFSECALAAVKQKQIFLRNAGDCFEQGANYTKAAHAYLEAEEFSRAAVLYCRAGMFDEAVQVVKAHRDQMDPLVVDEVIHVSRLYYFKEEKKLKYVSSQLHSTLSLTLS